MPETGSLSTELTSQYSAQVAKDLELNVQEQERISSEIASLHEQLEALRQDHTVLVNIRQAIGVPSTSAVTTTRTEREAAVPAPRKKAPATAGGSRQAKAKKSPAPARKRAAKKTDTKVSAPSQVAAKQAAPVKQTAATKKSASAKQPAPAKQSTPAKQPAAAKQSAPAGQAAKQPAAPTLVDIVRAHLSGGSEPRSAAEITAALTKKHPERTFKATVVRTTLEGLVAKNQAQRTKQGTSVFYIAPESEAPAAAAEKKTESA